MKKTKYFTLSAALLVLAAGVPFAGTAVAQPQPPMPQGLPAPPMLGDLHVRIVPNAPPQRRHELRTERPSRHQVWQGGFWHHTGSDWNWSDGRWAEPPRRHARWVGARYQKVRGGTRYIPGHWSTQRLIYR